MLYDMSWYDGEGEIETEEERVEWNWYVMLRKYVWDRDEIEELVWEMWYSGMIECDVKFEDWMRIVDVLMNGRWY